MIAARMLDGSTLELDPDTWVMPIDVDATELLDADRTITGGAIVTYRRAASVVSIAGALRALSEATGRVVAYLGDRWCIADIVRATGKLPKVEA